MPTDAKTENNPQNKRWCKWLQSAAALLALCVTAAIASLGNPAPGHAPFHVNCPPGSHGPLTWEGFGRKLEQSRERAIQLRQSQSRAITAGHPQGRAGAPG